MQITWQIILKDEKKEMKCKNTRTVLQSDGEDNKIKLQYRKILRVFESRLVQTTMMTTTVMLKSRAKCRRVAREITATQPSSGVEVKKIADLNFYFSPVSPLLMICIVVKCQPAAPLLWCQEQGNWFFVTFAVVVRDGA